MKKKQMELDGMRGEPTQVKKHLQQCQEAHQKEKEDVEEKLRTPQRPYKCFPGLKLPL